ncbi:MAG: M20/M25/M40 family metallo-hydrolase, partial [Gemmatimonadota bacterium]|nr:M20/M25/M40 family metallo-hydrolase [Gemmatimonadota bacterium]
GGENGTWFQRYPILRRQVETAKSHAGFMLKGKHIHASFESDARFWFGGVPDKEPHGQAVLLGGPVTAAEVATLDVKGKAVLLVADLAGQPSQGLFGAANALRERGAVGVMVISNRDSATFARSVATQAKSTRMDIPGVTPGGAPVLEVHERALGSVLSEAAIDLAAIRGSATPVIRQIPELTLGFGVKLRLVDSTSAPNTIGVVEGSDPQLRSEYVLFTAHMDHVGIAGQGSCRAKGADSICNGADDDASGTVGVIELAEAFSRSGARPKRSLIFMTVSGEERGLYGSAYYASHPTVPLGQIVANINLDMIGRNWPDTIVAIGREHSDLGQTLERVQAAHPELNMVAVDDRWPQENFYTRSDHYNFARKGVPILFFFNGVHDDYHQVSDSPDKIDSDKEARILKLLFYLGQEVANAPERPKWDPASFDKYVEKGGN